MSRSWRLGAVVGLLCAALPALSSGTASAAPSDPSCTPVTWDAPGFEWPRSVVDSYATFGDLHVVASLTDPASRNGDDSNPLADFGEAGVPGWAKRAYTGTLAGFGHGVLTLVMNSLTAGDALGLTFRFDRPVAIPDFTVGEIDSVTEGEIWHTHEDFVKVEAFRDDVPVTVAVTGAQTRVYATADLVTSLRLTFSDGPRDAEADAAAVTSVVWPAPATAVSDGMAIRIDGFTACDRVPTPTTTTTPAPTTTTAEPTTTATGTPEAVLGTSVEEPPTSADSWTSAPVTTSEQAYAVPDQGGLASTGADLGWLPAAGALLVVAGGLLLVVRRRVR
ncbi:LPXTG cell wall anchor domain-containing protein [Actinosynnema sp. NPDC020468]|uniref:LPXTG cell wall anchor domain-containing protein n=1 Tax=Actinosynnema sp. NPDC020468 TaxID=3154488 RepID=UPI0033F03C66